MAKQTSRRRLGKGLGSLIAAPQRVAVPKGQGDDGPPPPASEVRPSGDGIRTLEIGLIRANPLQPRKTFDESAMDALASSIRSAGLMQPVVVRPVGEEYELIAGERRWRAAQRAGLSSIPAVVRTADEREVAEWSLIENLQREDLNAIERAEAFRRLVEEFSLRHQDVAELVGMTRSSVTNHLRLLELDDDLQDLVRQSFLGLAHARALLAIANKEQRRDMALRAVREEWSARSLEREVARVVARPAAAQAAEEAPRFQSPRRANIADLERRLADHLGTKVQIRPGKKKGSGTLQIEFYDAAQFEGLVERMGFQV